MSQDDQLSIRGGQRPHHCFNFTTSFLTLAFLFRCKQPALQRKFVSIAVRAHHQRLFASLMPPQMIDRAVVSDLVNPRREFELGTVPRQGTVNLNEDFLRQVERGVVVAHHPINISRNGSLIASNELFKAAFVSAESSGYQIAIYGDVMGSKI